MLVLDLGEIKVDSNLTQQGKVGWAALVCKVHKQRLFLKHFWIGFRVALTLCMQATLEDVSAGMYDRFDIQLNDVSALLFAGQHDESAASKSVVVLTQKSLDSHVSEQHPVGEPLVLGQHR